MNPICDNLSIPKATADLPCAGGPPGPVTQQNLGVRSVSPAQAGSQGIATHSKVMDAGCINHEIFKVVQGGGKSLH